MKTLANIYLLPTDKVSNLWLASDNNILWYDNHGKVSYRFNAQHLYITLPQSDLEISKIKENSLILFKQTDGNRFIHRVNKASLLNITKDDELIVGTTEPYLNSHFISQSFIEHFIVEYNKGNVIKQVKVELEDRYNTIKVGSSLLYEEDQLHFNPSLKLNQNNEVSIVVPEKKIYSRKEVDILCRKAYSDGYDKANLKEDSFPNYSEYEDEWIKQNL